MAPAAAEGSAELQAVPSPQKSAAAESAGIAAEQAAKAPAADEAERKVSKETVVAEPVPPKAEKRKLRLSMAAGEKKRLKKRHHKRHAAMRHGVRVPRCKRRRVCPCVYGYGHRDARAFSGRTYVVRRGDTLSGIAARIFGDGAHYRAIYRANRGQIRNPNLIYPRQRLYIP
jgi:nucleoid-associated protein YgaU